jgi:putative aminopeptidase FrvX
MPISRHKVPHSLKESQRVGTISLREMFMDIKVPSKYNREKALVALHVG